MQMKTKKICYMWWKCVSEEKKCVTHVGSNASEEEEIVLHVVPVKKKKYLTCGGSV